MSGPPTGQPGHPVPGPVPEIQSRSVSRSRRYTTTRISGRAVCNASCPVVQQFYGHFDAPGEELIGQVAVCERPKRCGAWRHDALTLFGLMLGSLQLSRSSPLRPTSDARFLSRGLVAAVSDVSDMLVPLGSSRCVGCAGGWVRIEAQQHAPTWRGLSPWPTPTASRSLSN
jgi:hypothetical protein